MTKTEKIKAWLITERNASYGNLHLIGCFAYTYNVLLAVVDHTNSKAWVNNRSYSCTSSGHRNRLLEALNEEDYDVVLTDGPPQIPEGFEETSHGR